MIDTRLARVLPPKYGDIKSAKQMAGMGGGEVYLVTLADRQVIAKRVNHNSERYFYTDIAPNLRRRSLATPELLATEEIDDQPWIVLEAIPHKLPKAEWNSSKVLSYLGRLHSFAAAEHAELKTRAWTTEMNARALSFFQESDLPFMRVVLDRLRERYHHLFRAEHLISGDCSIDNWGLDVSGSPVLYDWERVGKGTAALDLATLVPSFPPMPVIDEFALGYGHQVPDRNVDHAALASDVAAAIVWTVVDIFCLHDAGRIRLTSGVIDHCRERVPAWVAEARV